MPRESTVLLVDDDRDVVEGSSMRLRSAGYETMAAYDGEECVDRANEFQPVAIVLDVRMPRMDGLTALGELQEGDSTKHIPVVMLSASLSDQRAALEAGARFFLRKPYSGPMLIAAIKAAIEEAYINRADAGSAAGGHQPEIHIRWPSSPTDNSKQS